MLPNLLRDAGPRGGTEREKVHSGTAGSQANRDVPPLNGTERDPETATHGTEIAPGSDVVGEDLQLDRLVHCMLLLATFRRKKPFSDDRAIDLGARTRRQVAAGKV